MRDAHHIVLPVTPSGDTGNPAGDAPQPLAVITPAELEAVRDYIDFVRGLQCQLDEKVAEQLAAEQVVVGV